MRNQHQHESRGSFDDPHFGALMANAERPITRRTWLGVLAGIAGGAAFGTVATERLWASALPARLSPDPITAYVYSNAHNGCCNGWIAHLELNGFRVMTGNVEDLETFKRQLGVPRALWSCHTALVGNYIIEGHVPADVISRARRDLPSIRGLAVAGMPPGAPGLEGTSEVPYQVVAFTTSGETFVYADR